MNKDTALKRLLEETSMLIAITRAFVDHHQDPKVYGTPNISDIMRCLIETEKYRFYLHSLKEDSQNDKPTDE